MITLPSPLTSPKFLGVQIPSRQLRLPTQKTIRLAPRFSAAQTSAHERPSPARAQEAASLYDVLGLSPRATGQEIKSAYRRLARECHPDAQRGASGEEFMRVHAAYATLSDPEKRGEYDTTLMAVGWQRRSSGSPYSFSFSSFSGSAGRRWETDQCW